MPLLHRRSLLSGGASALLVGCRGRREPATDERVAVAAGWRELDFAPGDGAPDGQMALVHAPAEARDWPVLVALHGRGEAGRGLLAGARGWRDDYGLDEARAKLETGALRADDAGGWLGPERTAALNASLGRQRYRGVVVACPYTPVPSGRGLGASGAFASFVASRLLPEVARARGGPVARDGTGIDGVSMGGRYALELGFSSPDTYASVGALQPAIRPEEASAFAELAKAAALRKPQKIRLVSSDDDPFLEATRALSDALRAAGLEHGLVVTGGPHDYAWNRGPGGIELLAFHERVLRGLPPP